MSETPPATRTRKRLGRHRSERQGPEQQRPEEHSPQQQGPERRRAGKWRRRLRKTLLGLLVAWLVVTLTSVVFNLATTPPYTFAATQGSDVDVAGTRVHYERWGDSGTPVVLVHGFAESSVSWTPAAVESARHHVVYAIDLAGSGHTEYTGHYTLADQTTLMLGFLRALRIDKPVLIGHSMGAAVVGSVALKSPDAVAGVIFADGDALPFGDPNQAGQRSRPPSWVARIPYVTSGYRTATGWHWLSNRLVRWQCGTRCVGVTPELVTQWMRPLRQGAAERAMFQTGMFYLLPAQIQKISVPRGIIWGAEDATSGGWLSAAQQNLGHPRTELIADAGHLSMVADPPAFAAAAERLITSMAT